MKGNTQSMIFSTTNKAEIQYILINPQIIRSMKITYMGVSGRMLIVNAVLIMPLLYHLQTSRVLRLKP